MNSKNVYSWNKHSIVVVKNFLSLQEQAESPQVKRFPLCTVPSLAKAEREWTHPQRVQQTHLWVAVVSCGYVHQSINLLVTIVCVPLKSVWLKTTSTKLRVAGRRNKVDCLIIFREYNVCGMKSQQNKTLCIVFVTFK